MEVLSNRFVVHLPMLVTLAICGALLAHGPMAQDPNYNLFADQSTLLGVPHAGDVFSNIGFAIVGVWGWLSLWQWRAHPALREGWHGYAQFLIGLVLTAFGSGYYHLAPDNGRLVWDRLGIVLVCAGLLSAVRAETRAGAHKLLYTSALIAYGVLSVAWWTYTEHQHGGPGDLRPYILLQLLPLVLIPLWQAIYKSPHADRIGFGALVLLYVLAKLAEIWDHELLAVLGWISGHTLKHLLAAAAAAVIVITLRHRLMAGADRAL
jgi:hypothetical protein